MRITHDSTVKTLASAVILLGAFAAISAQAVDRQAQARAAAQAAQSFVSRPNPYAAGTAQNIAFEQQRAATSQALSKLNGAAASSRSTEVSSQRGAADGAQATTGALTQPLQVQRQDPLPAQSTALGGSDDKQASYLTEIALTAQRNTTATSDALQMSRQQVSDVATAIQQSSNEGIAKMLQIIQAQIATKRAQDQAEAARVATAKAAAPKKLKVSDRIKVASTTGSGTGLNYVPSVFNETSEIVGDLGQASKEFQSGVGVDNVAASVNRK